MVCLAGKSPYSQSYTHLESARTIYIRCTYEIYSREITIHTVIYGVYIQLRLTLYIPTLYIKYDHSPEEGSQDSGEDAVDRLVAHFGEADEVEVAKETVGDGVAPTTCDG